MGVRYRGELKKRVECVYLKSKLRKAKTNIKGPTLGRQDGVYDQHNNVE
jgi:hypothetical protein